MSPSRYRWMLGHAHLLRLGNRLASNLGVSQARRVEVYLDVSQAATLLDAGYWLQVFFSAGIATLGLVLDSPAVIIGAMLISPLMGPILSGGLAVAAGDLVLGVRSVINLLLSGALSAGLATLLIWMLPFKEVTSEIAARTQPNILDLAIALFSGAIGSVSICKQAKGMVTSIPGVAIAVALMPPLCVVGFGVGVATSLGDTTGLRIARGGGLLFLTNLVAIMFTAMVVFIILRINTGEVRRQVSPQLEQDVENVRVRALLRKVPIVGQLAWLRSLAARVVFSIILLAALAMPLSRSFTQLKEEIIRKQQEDKLLNAATQLCEEKLPGKEGEPRCYVGHLALTDQPFGIELSLRVFTRKPYSEEEKYRYVEKAAAILHRPPASISLQLVEVPTTSRDLVAEQAKEQKGPPPLTLGQLQAGLSKAVDSSMQDLELPVPAQLIEKKVLTGIHQPSQVTMAYLSDHPMGDDAKNLLTSEIQRRLMEPRALVSFDYVPANSGSLAFRLNRTHLTGKDKTVLEVVGNNLEEYSALELLIHVRQAKAEKPFYAEERRKALLAYFQDRWKVAPARIQFSSEPEAKRTTVMILQIHKTGDGTAVASD